MRSVREPGDGVIAVGFSSSLPQQRWLVISRAKNEIDIAECSRWKLTAKAL
jgi:hypothetical protein